MFDSIKWDHDPMAGHLFADLVKQIDVDSEHETDFVARVYYQRKSREFHLVIGFIGTIYTEYRAKVMTPDKINENLKVALKYFLKEAKATA